MLHGGREEKRKRNVFTDTRVKYDILVWCGRVFLLLFMITPVARPILHVEKGTIVRNFSRNSSLKSVFLCSFLRAVEWIHKPPILIFKQPMFLTIIRLECLFSKKKRERKSPLLWSTIKYHEFEGQIRWNGLYPFRGTVRVKSAKLPD